MHGSHHSVHVKLHEIVVDAEDFCREQEEDGLLLANLLEGETVLNVDDGYKSC